MFESESVFAFAKYHYLASFPRFLNVSSLIKLHLGEIRLKNKSHPPLTKQKLTLTSPHLLIILRSIPPPPPLHPPHVGSLIPNLRVGCLPQAQKSTSNDSNDFAK